MPPNKKDNQNHQQKHFAHSCPNSRPCARIGCKFHLCSDLRGQHLYIGGKKLSIDESVDYILQAQYTCALDESQHPHTLEEIGERLGGLSRERVRQIEEQALKKVAKHEFPEPGEEPNCWLSLTISDRVCASKQNKYK